MPSFTYSAKDLSGESVRGSIDAVNRKVALQKLAAQKLRPLSVNEANESRAGKGGLSGFSSLFSSSSAKPKVKALNRSVALPFLTGIRELLNCGIQSADALRMMSARLSDPRQKLLATNLWDELRQGRSLSEAFRKQPKVFHESVVSLVEAGEATGNLKNVLTRIVESMEEQKAIRGKLVAALSYPCFLILVAIGLVFLFLFSLLPRIEGLLASLGGNLPASTKILIATADGLLNYGWIAAIGIALVVALLVSWRKSPTGRFKFDAFLLRIPGAGRIVRDTQILQFTQTLSLLLEKRDHNGSSFGHGGAVAFKLFHARAFSEAVPRWSKGLPFRPHSSRLAISKIWLLTYLRWEKTRGMSYQGLDRCLASIQR